MCQQAHATARRGVQASRRPYRRRPETRVRRVLHRSVHVGHLSPAGNSSWRGKEAGPVDLRTPMLRHGRLASRMPRRYPGVGRRHRQSVPRHRASPAKGHVLRQHIAPEHVPAPRRAPRSVRHRYRLSPLDGARQPARRRRPQIHRLLAALARNSRHGTVEPPTRRHHRELNTATRYRRTQASARRSARSRLHPGGALPRQP